MVWRGKRRPSENTKRQMLYINIHWRDFLSQIHVCIDLLLSGRTLVTGKYGWHFSRDVTPFVWCSFFCATSCYVAKMHQFSTKPTCLGGQLPMYYIKPEKDWTKMILERQKEHRQNTRLSFHRLISPGTREETFPCDAWNIFQKNSASKSSACSILVAPSCLSFSAGF